jgi:protein-disulfide isomerase
MRRDVRLKRFCSVGSYRAMRRARLLIAGSVVVAGWVGLDAAIDITGAPARGGQNAPLTLVEFSDYQCPSCGYYIANVYPKLNRDYVRTGKVRYAVKNFPIESVHPLAFKAHEAAMCAAEQGKFWEMHDRLFANQQGLQQEFLEQYAGQAGLVSAMFRLCVASGRAAAFVRRDMAEGVAAGVQGTPTIVLGFTKAPSAAVRAERVIVGEHPYEEYKSAIESLLSVK